MKGFHLKEKRKDTRSKLWIFILYPESLPSDWLNILKGFCVPLCLSPLHDSDVYEDNTESHSRGEKKKPHYHGIFCFDSKTTFSRVKEMLDLLNAPIPVVCKSLNASIRYLIHFDNPEKAQYSKDSIQVFYGMNVQRAFALQRDDYPIILDKLFNVISTNEIREYSLLLDTVREINPSWLPVAIKYAFALDRYLTSKRWSQKKPNKIKTNTFE